MSAKMNERVKRVSLNVASLMLGLPMVLGLSLLAREDVAMRMVDGIRAEPQQIASVTPVKTVKTIEIAAAAAK